MRNKVDIIVSCYNEEDNIFAYYNEAKKYLKDKKYVYNIYYINDGSRDKTYEKILELKKKVSKERNSAVKISYLSFIHNFGHEAAMCAGMNTSKADYMIVMDVDLQNPPQKIPEILKKFEKGADCVLLKRVQYKNVSLMKKITSNGYYLFSKYILRNANERNVSDFFAVDKTLAKKVNDNYKTRLRFIRGFVQREATCIKKVNFKNGIRFSGVSRYNYYVLTKLAIISELSRSKFLRKRFKATKEKPIYIVDKKRTKYE